MNRTFGPVELLGLANLAHSKGDDTLTRELCDRAERAMFDRIVSPDDDFTDTAPIEAPLTIVPVDAIVADETARAERPSWAQAVLWLPVYVANRVCLAVFRRVQG